MKIYLLFCMCHFAMGLTHCYKTTVFFTFFKLAPLHRWLMSVWMSSIFFQVHTPTIFLRFSQKHGTRVLCIIRTKLDFFQILLLEFLANFWFFFQIANSSYSFFSDSDEIWHTRCMYQCTKKTMEQIFKILIAKFAAQQQIELSRPIGVLVLLVIHQYKNNVGRYLSSK